MAPVFRSRSSPFQNDNGSHPESLEAILLLNSDRVASRAIIAIKSCFSLELYILVRKIFRNLDSWDRKC